MRQNSSQIGVNYKLFCEREMDCDDFSHILHSPQCGDSKQLFGLIYCFPSHLYCSLVELIAYGNVDSCGVQTHSLQVVLKNTRGHLSFIEDTF